MPFQSVKALVNAFLAVIAIATIAAGIGIYSGTHAAINRQVDRRILTATRQIIGIGPVTLSGLSQRIEESERHRDTADIGIALMDDRGRPVAGHLKMRGSLPLGLSDIDSATGISGLSDGRALVMRIGPDHKLIVVVESEPIDGFDLQRIWILLVGLGLLLLFVVVGTLALRNAITKRLVALRTTADAIIEGNLSHRVPMLGRHNEFNQLAYSFNAMLNRIEELMAEIVSVTNDIAHDLRTPISRLRAELASIAVKVGAGPVRQDLNRAIADSDEILKMFTSMLRIAEIEGFARRERFVAIDLGSLAERVVDGLEPMIVDSGRVVVTSLALLCVVRGDRQLLMRLIVNLIENAVLHTPEGATIRLSVAHAGETVALEVRDDGPGIRADQMATALRRFGRLDRSRGQTGHGLGLPLCQAIAKLHGGELKLGDAMPGLRVTICIPKE